MSDTLMRSLKGGRILLGGFLLVLFLLLIGRWGIGLYVDLLWFSAQGASEVYLTQVAWEWGTRALVGLVTVLVTWLNLRLVARTFAGLQVRRRFGDLVIQEQLPASYVRWGILLGSLFVGFWFATAVPQGTGLQGMLLANAEPWGQTDPILGRDFGFYVFVLPMLQVFSAFGLILVIFLGVISGAGYAATGSIGWGDRRLLIDDAARLHLGVLAASFIVLVGIRFYLAPYGLLLDGSSSVQAIFGFADHQARIPTYRILGFLAMITAGTVLWGAYQGRLMPIAAGGVALTISSIALVQVYPAFVQRFRVQPNELERETPYIEYAVAHTRQGFGLDLMERTLLPYQPPDGAAWDVAAERLGRLPVWTEETLLTTFRQLEARFQYYDFHEVAFDRYPAGGRTEPVAVSVREIDPAEIPDQSWQNLHLRERFIAGAGAVAGQLNRRTEEGRIPVFLTAIPPELRAGPEVPDGFELTRPAIYIGTRTQFYALINPQPGTFLAPDGGPGVPGEDYPTGVPVGSILRTAALAWWAQDPNLLFSSEVESTSRLVFRRYWRERLRTLAPFLYFPEEPYPVVQDGRIVWIVEGFTWSNYLPLSSSHEIPGERSVNYLRNSVKATVDAVTGETAFYVVEPSDPILAAYRRGFPTLFRDIAEMPEALQGHLRYSRYLMEAQTAVLTRYHQRNPQVFHGQQDRWALAREFAVTAQSSTLAGGGFSDVPYRPEYALLALPGETEESYVLSTLFVPQGRENLASFLAARWTPERGGELLLWDIAVEAQIRGPSQIESMIEQDPEISQQFSLWRQGGSQVWTGHLYLVPVAETLLYMEPIFLAADENAIPEIRRFVVSDGRRVVMRTTLEESVAALAGGFGQVPAEEFEGPMEALAPGAEASPVPPLAAGSSEALGILERAETRLRAGDWEGFGAGLDTLRMLLREQAPGAGF